MKGLVHIRCLALLAATSAIWGCRPKSPDAPEVPVAAPAPRGLTLQEIADRIDPGAQAPLTEQLPPWMFALIGLDADPQASGKALLDLSATEQADVDAQVEAGVTDHTSMVSASRSVARSVVLAEQAMARGAADADVLARLERAYAAVDVPMLASDRSTFGKILLLFAEAAAGDGPKDNAQLQELAGVVQGAMRAAGPLHRRTVAQLLRTAPDHEAVPTALLAAAMAQRGGDADWPIRAAKLAVERRGASATAQQQLDLASVCFAGLDVACGDDALSIATSMEGTDAADLADVDQQAALARRIVELVDASTIDGRLERARALLKLGRHAAAKAEFETLRVDFPMDARPVGGLAHHAVETEFDFSGANRIIDAQDGLTHGDAAYYELAIGTRAMAALSTLVPTLAADGGTDLTRRLEPLLHRMRVDIDAYAALGNTDGRYLGWVFDIGAELLAQYDKEGSVSLLRVRSLSDRAEKLQSEIPDNPHAYRMLMSVALFEADKSRAAALAKTAVPDGPDHAALMVRRARALADLAVTWSDPSLARQARDVARKIDVAASPEAAELFADAALVQALLGGAGAWGPIAEAYDALLGENLTPEDARTLNNLGFAVLKNDGLPVAQQAWEASAQLSEDHGDVAKLNVLVSKTPAGDSAALAAMSVLAAETEVAGVRVTALAWVLAWSKGKARRRDAKAALDAAIEAAKKDGARPAAPDPYSGLVLEGSFNAGLGYAIKTGLKIEMDGSGRPWAILAPQP